MIEETATVVAATPDHIWVEARARSACSSCGTQDSCATSSVSKLFGMRRQQLRLPNPVSYTHLDVYKRQRLHCDRH